MRFEGDWPEDLKDLLLGAEGQEIFTAIQCSAERCLDVLKEALFEKEIDSDKAEQIQTIVQEEMEEADKTHFSLTTVDNKIKRRKRESSAIRKYIFERESQGKKDTLELMLEMLAAIGTEEFAPEIEDTIGTFYHEVAQSLRLRIQMTWSWDSILDGHRDVLVTRCIFLGHKLTEIAIRLLNEDAIQKVRKLLSALDLKIPQTQFIYSLPESPEELLEMLETGIQFLERLHDYVVTIDTQRRELKEAQVTLVAQYKKPPSKNSSNSRPLEKPNNSNSTREIFPDSD